MCLEQLLQNKVRIKQGLVDLGGLPCDVDATVRASAKSFQSYLEQKKNFQAICDYLYQTTNIIIPQYDYSI